MACDITSNGPLGTATQNAYEMISPIINEGMPFIAVAQNKWQALGELFFKREIKEEAGTAYLNFVFKGGLGGNRTFQRVWTNSNCAIEWREMSITPAYTTVATAATAAATLTLTNVADLKGIAANSRLVVARATGLVMVTVQSIAGNVITLESGQTITAAIGDKVYRGAYNRDTSCTAAISNKYTVRQPKKYEAYFRKINITLEFATCDLSVDRFSNYLEGSNGAQVYVDSLNYAALEGFMNEMRQAVYLDRNLVKGNTVNNNGAPETMGLLPAIQKAQVTGGMNLMYDYSTCCVGTTRADTLKMIGAFFDVLLSAHQSGFYDTGVVTVVANSAQLQEILKLQGALAEFTGVTVFHDNSGEAFNVGMDIAKIKYGPLTVEFIYEEFLDMYTKPMHIVLPKNQIMLFQRKYAAVGADMKVTEQINGFIDSGIPYLKFKDRTDVVTNGMGDCFVFQGEFEFAVAYAGVDKGAYRVGLNLKSCEAECTVCTTGSTTILSGEGL